MRYFFDTDGDGHWYQIPVGLRDEWNRLSSDDDAWELPEWQKFEDCRLNGGISSITFENPIEQ